MSSAAAIVVAALALGCRLHFLCHMRKGRRGCCCLTERVDALVDGRTRH